MLLITCCWTILWSRTPFIWSNDTASHSKGGKSWTTPLWELQKWPNCSFLDYDIFNSVIFLPVFEKSLLIRHSEDTCIIADMKASCMLRKATPKNAEAYYFETVRFYKVQHLLACSLFATSPQSQQSTRSIQYHSTAQIIQQIAGPCHRSSGPYAPLEAQMSLLYRTAHIPTLGDCCLSTDSVYWFRMILQMSSDDFPKNIKGLVCVT